MKLFTPDRRLWAANTEPDPPPDNTTMNLYCWRHRWPHVILLPDVERIVYALGPAPTDAYFSGLDDGGANFGLPEPTRDRDEQPPCWLEVLRWADDSEMYAEHVEQGIECREKS